MESQANNAEVVRAAAAVITCGGPDRFLSRRVKLTGDETGYQTTERRADFMRAGREPLTNQHDNARRNARQ